MSNLAPLSGSATHRDRQAEKITAAFSCDRIRRGSFRAVGRTAGQRFDFPDGAATDHVQRAAIGAGEREILRRPGQLDVSVRSGLPAAAAEPAKPLSVTAASAA